MTAVGELERETQRRVIRHFRDHLGYTYLGNWHERDNNRNIEPDYLTRFLKRQGHSPALITKALDKLGKAAAPGRKQDPLRSQPRRLQSSCATASRSVPDSASTRSQFT